MWTPWLALSSPECYNSKSFSPRPHLCLENSLYMSGWKGEGASDGEELVKVWSEENHSYNPLLHGDTLDMLVPPRLVLLSPAVLQFLWPLFINTRTPLSKLTLFSSQCPSSCRQSCKISNLFSLLSLIPLWLLANHTNCSVTLSALPKLIVLQPSLTHSYFSNAKVYVWALVSKTERLILQTL